MINSNNNSSKNQIMIQLIQYQKAGLPYILRLEIDDIKRIIENINTSPFDPDKCCIWNGYITNNNNKSKYINFYFKHRKIALHRLLYINYIDNIDNKSYLKFTCQNKGICCNINHLEICNKDNVTKEPTNKIITNKNPTLQVIKLNNNSDINHSRKFIVVFD
jgi:hypothetical protein